MPVPRVTRQDVVRAPAAAATRLGDQRRAVGVVVDADGQAERRVERGRRKPEPLEAGKVRDARSTPSAPTSPGRPQPDRFGGRVAEHGEPRLEAVDHLGEALEQR